jgi:hypothetical protein
MNAGYESRRLLRSDSTIQQLTINDLKSLRVPYGSVLQ